MEKKTELWYMVLTSIRMMQLPVERKEASSFQDKAHLLVPQPPVPHLSAYPPPTLNRLKELVGSH